MGRRRVYVGNNLDLSRIVQKELHAGGGWWNKDGPDRHKIYAGEAEWICLGPDMEVSYDSTFSSSFGEEMTLQELFRDKGKWKTPVKEMTVSEISEKLGYEVKVVK